MFSTSAYARTQTHTHDPNELQRSNIHQTTTSATHSHTPKLNKVHRVYIFTTFQ